MNLFITGTTGFVGGELLVKIAKRDDLKKIYCLVRAKSYEDGMARLRKVFALHDDHFPEGKIFPVVHDLLDENLPNSLATIKELNDIDMVIHSAANTSFSRIFDTMIEKVNLTGLRNILTWAATLKRLQLFTYVGTATICGKNVINTIIHEDSSPDINSKHVVKYTWSKMMGEMMLKEFIPEEKLLVVRPSIIMGDSTHKVPRSNVILWTVATSNFMRLFPINPDVKLDIIPVDYAAKAIEAVVFAPHRTHSVYHISSGVAGVTTPRKIVEAIKPFFKAYPEFTFTDISMMTQMKNWTRNRTEKITTLNDFSDYLKYWEQICDFDRGKLRILFAGLEPYLYFMELGQIFDNSRLLTETDAGQSPAADTYLENCIEFLGKIDIFAGALNP